MHLKNRPTYFVKNGIRKPVYYTVDARQLIDNGWLEEGKTAVATPAESVKVTGVPISITSPEPPEAEQKASPEIEAEPSLGDMTRAELVQFAEANGVGFKSYATKGEILEACTKLVRARNTDGTFIADDPATPDVNEAWVPTDG